MQQAFQHSLVWSDLHSPSDEWASQPNFWYTDMNESRHAVVKSYISCGEFGEVFKARVLESGKPVVVKRARVVVKEQLPTGEIIREAAALSLMRNSPNVVRFETLERGMWLFQEEMPKSLYEYLAHRPAPHKQTLNILYQIAEGLDHCHSKNLVHRDIKPTNILIDEREPIRVKLCDFGMSKVISPEVIGLHTPLVVTIWYRSPELLVGNCTSYGSEVDMWSYGCVAYEVITGKPLFPYETEMGMLKGIKGTWPKFNSPYAKVLEVTLKMEPKERAKASDVRDMLFSIAMDHDL